LAVFGGRKGEIMVINSTEQCPNCGGVRRFHVAWGHKENCPVCDGQGVTQFGAKPEMENWVNLITSKLGLKLSVGKFIFLETDSLAGLFITPLEGNQVYLAVRQIMQSQVSPIKVAGYCIWYDQTWKPIKGAYGLEQFRDRELYRIHGEKICRIMRARYVPSNNFSAYDIRTDIFPLDSSLGILCRGASRYVRMVYAETSNKYGCMVWDENGMMVWNKSGFSTSTQAIEAGVNFLDR
jgi:hypothetical protein